VTGGRRYRGDHRCRDAQREAAKDDWRCPVAPPGVARAGWQLRLLGLRLRPRHRRCRGNSRGRRRSAAARVWCRDDSRRPILCRAWSGAAKVYPRHLHRAWMEVAKVDSLCRSPAWLEVERVDSLCRSQAWLEVAKVDFPCSGDYPMEVVRRRRRRTDGCPSRGAPLASMARARRLMATARAWKHCHRRGAMNCRPRDVMNCRQRGVMNCHRRGAMNCHRRGAMNCRRRVVMSCRRRVVMSCRRRGATRFHRHHCVLLLRRHVLHRHRVRPEKRRQTSPPARLPLPLSQRVVSAWSQFPFTRLISIRPMAGCGSPSSVRLLDSQVRRSSESLV
jgi:hypothetical protein